MLNMHDGENFKVFQINLGPVYTNDFNAFGRFFHVLTQANEPCRLDQEDIGSLRVRSVTGALVPLGTSITIKETAGPALVQRYNQQVSVPVQGSPAPGISTRQVLLEIETLAESVMPPGLGSEWTELALQERDKGDTALDIFGFSILFAFLLLPTLHESRSLPLVIVLIVSLAMLGAVLSEISRGMDNNILTQVGLVVLVGLAAKNVPLIVEFAKQAQKENGLSSVEAAVEASQLRLRLILMTALAFILGVLPLLAATGPGLEMRRSLGTAMFFGTPGVMVLSHCFSPVFHVLVRRIFPG